MSIHYYTMAWYRFCEPIEIFAVGDQILIISTNALITSLVKSIMKSLEFIHLSNT